MIRTTRVDEGGEGVTLQSHKIETLARFEPVDDGARWSCNLCALVEIDDLEELCRAVLRKTHAHRHGGNPPERAAAPVERENG